MACVLANFKCRLICLDFLLQIVDHPIFDALCKGKHHNFVDIIEVGFLCNYLVVKTSFMEGSLNGAGHTFGVTMFIISTRVCWQYSFKTFARLVWSLSKSFYGALVGLGFMAIPWSLKSILEDSVNGQCRVTKLYRNMHPFLTRSTHSNNTRIFFCCQTCSLHSFLRFYQAKLEQWSLRCFVSSTMIWGFLHKKSCIFMSPLYISCFICTYKLEINFTPKSPDSQNLVDVKL